MFNSSCQKVTGLVTNNKIGIQRYYWKNTRAMCYNYFKKGEFYTPTGNGKSEQLLGRLSFINQIDKYNNCLLKKSRTVFNLNTREKMYRDYIFYEKFYNNKKPIIVTEGKTDILYLRAARYVFKNYERINFSRFKETLNIMETIINSVDSTC